jgi:hypothetical protein
MSPVDELSKLGRAGTVVMVVVCYLTMVEDLFIVAAPLLVKIERK